MREQLLGLSDYDMFCTYSILDSPMPLTNYVATLRLTPITDQERTFIEWSADFDCAPDKEAELVAGIGTTSSRAASTPSSAPSGVAMLHVVRSTIIDAPVDRLWSVLRDFNGHDRWHPIVARSEIGAYPPDRTGSAASGASSCATAANCASNC